MKQRRTVFQVDFFFLAAAALILADLSPLRGLLMLMPALLHEGGHLLMLAVCGGRPSAIRLQLFGVGVEGGREQLTRRQELLVLAAGPLVNLFCAGFFAFPAPRFSPEMTELLCLPHLALGLWNLMPVPPADGGRILVLLLTPYLSPRALRLTVKITAVCFLLPVTLPVLRALFHGSRPLTALFCLIYLWLCLFRW